MKCTKKSKYKSLWSLLTLALLAVAGMMPVRAQEINLPLPGDEEYSDYVEIFRDTAEYVAPTTIVMQRDTILDPLRVVTNKFGKNWFFFGVVGVHSYVGDYSRLGPFKGTISPDFAVGVGKWFTPGVGLKAEFEISDSRGYTTFSKGHYGYGEMMTNSKGEQYRKMRTGWWDLSLSAVLNLSRLFKGFEGIGNRKLMNQFMFTVGLGMVHHTGFKGDYGSDNELSAHAELQYSRFFTPAKRFSLDFKLKGIFYQTNFDLEYGQADNVSRKVDCNLGVALSFTWYLGKKRSNGWDQSTTKLYQRDFRQQNVLVVRQKDVVVETGGGVPKQGTMTFYVFYPNNYSGRNDAPIVPSSDVNTMDYLAAGLFTQKKYADTGAATSKLLSGASLNGLKTVDIPTELAEELTFAEYMPRGYEMSDSIPISLSLKPQDMTAFREKEGFYYAPIYDGQHVWQYRIDDATQGQVLLSDANYAESQTFGLNAHNGLDIIKENMKVDSGDELVSFADFYAAINGNEGYISQFTDPETVARIQDILRNGVITMVQTEGMATSQDNYTGANASQVGRERNSALSENRANSVMKWLQQNEKLTDALYQSFFTQGNNTINKVTDESTRGLNAKLNRGVKVRIHYLKK